MGDGKKSCTKWQAKKSAKKPTSTVASSTPISSCPLWILCHQWYLMISRRVQLRGIRRALSKLTTQNEGPTICCSLRYGGSYLPAGVQVDLQVGPLSFGCGWDHTWSSHTSLTRLGGLSSRFSRPSFKTRFHYLSSFEVRGIHWFREYTFIPKTLSPLLKVYLSLSQFVGIGAFPVFYSFHICTLEKRLEKKWSVR